jgi:hypothetical protein
MVQILQALEYMFPGTRFKEVSKNSIKKFLNVKIFKNQKECQKIHKEQNKKI